MRSLLHALHLHLEHVAGVLQGEGEASQRGRVGWATDAIASMPEGDGCPEVVDGTLDMAAGAPGSGPGGCHGVYHIPQPFPFHNGHHYLLAVGSRGQSFRLRVTVQGSLPPPLSDRWASWPGVGGGVGRK
jgi:hypothetical protein